MASSSPARRKRRGGVFRCAGRAWSFPLVIWKTSESEAAAWLDPPVGTGHSIGDVCATCSSISSSLSRPKVWVRNRTRGGPLGSLESSGWIRKLAVVYCEFIGQVSNWVISEGVTRVGLSYPRGVLRCHRSSPRVLTNACCVRVCWEST